MGKVNLIQENILLKNYSNFKIGGPAKYFLEFHSLDELKNGLAEWGEILKNEETIADRKFVIAGATNILFDDAGYDGLILCNRISFIKNLSEEVIEVGAGTSVKELNDFCLQNSLSGTEWSGGLPGTVGGAIFGNAGAFGGETKDSIIEVTSYAYKSNQLIRRSGDDCRFGYRDSIFKSGKLTEIILVAKIAVRSGDKAEIAKTMDEHIDYRRRKQPLEYPNIGSIFKNVPVKSASQDLIEKVKEKIKNDPFPVIPTAYLIFLAGLVGHKIGGAQVSEKHPNMMINVAGTATATNVRDLIKLVQEKVKEKFGVDLEPEVRILSQVG